MGALGDLVKTHRIKEAIDDAGCTAEPWACAISGQCINGCGAPRRAAEAAEEELTANLNVASDEVVARFHSENPPTNAEIAKELGVSKRQASKIRRQLGIGAHRDMRDVSVQRELMGEITREVAGE